LRYASPLLALFALGCISDVALEIELVALSPVPSEVSSWELRLVRLEGDDACPSVNEAAGAWPVGRLAHAQTFATEGMVIGEVPEGRWGFAVLARDDACTVRMYGCREVVITGGVESPIVIEVDAASSPVRCGCLGRECSAGVCEGASVCE